MEFNGFQNREQLLKVSNLAGWQLYEFGDVLYEDTKNATKIKKEDYLPNGKYPIVDQGQTYIAGYTNEDEGLYKDNPVIIFGDHTRIIKYIDFPIFIGADGVKLLRTKVDCNTKYIYYYLTSLKLPDDGYSRHFKYLKQVIIPIPSIQTQHKIVQVLDKAQSLIDKRKEQIKQCDELIQSLFYDMFGDPGINSKGFKVAQISDLVDHNIKKVSKVYEEEDTIKYIDISSIDNETNKITNYSIYKVKDAPSRAQQCLCKGDIIISTVRPNLKNVAMVLSEDEDLVGSSGFCVLRSNKINNQYLFRYVLSEYFTKKLTSMTTGANYPAIKKNDVLEQTILLPPLELQNQFAEKVQKIEKQKQLLQQSLSLLEDNFNSLMQKAFKGELFQ